MKISAFTPLVATLFVAYAYGQTGSPTGSPTGFETLEKSLPAFKSLVVELPVNVEVDASKAPGGVLVAAPADLDKVVWEVRGDQLIIKAAEGAVFEASVNLSLGGLYLERIESTEDAVIYVHHVDRKTLGLDMINGTIKLEGQVNKLQVMAEKAKVFANELISKEARVTIWDAGNVVLHTSEKLDVKATNHGKVVFSGNPGQLSRTTCNGALVVSSEELENSTAVEMVNFQL